MLVESDRRRLLALWRGLLCLVLTAALGWLSPGDRIETQERDHVSDASNATGGAWFARGTPRIVKRSVGDHLAIHPSPDVLALAPSEPWAAEIDEWCPNSACRHQGASVRGPPQD
jgi:hypothetical protein